MHFSSRTVRFAALAVLLIAALLAAGLHGVVAGGPGRCRRCCAAAADGTASGAKM